MNATIAALIEKHLNATLTAAEAAMLAQAMAESPALAEEFVAATRMESDLSASMKDGARTALYTRRMERAAAETEPAPSRRQWPVKTMAAAAGIAALAVVAWRLMEMETVTGVAVKKASPSLPQLYSGGSASISSDTRTADASALKRKLRRFASSTSNLRRMPVSQAVAVLEREWKDYAHGNTMNKEIVFTIADSVRSEWQKPEDEPAVSLEIPGISLLTSLDLIAAQAGLKASVTPAGVSLEHPARKDDGKDRTWTIPLSVASVTSFMRAVSSDGDRTNATIAWKNSNWSGLTAPGLVRADRPSWLQVPELAGAPGWSNYSNSGPVDGGVVVWDDAINKASFDPTGTRILLNTADAGITLSTIASGGGGLHDLWVEGLPQAVLSEHPSDVSNDLIVATDAGQTDETSTSGVSADLNSDGYTIDLTLAPEVVEFEGFINYGEPIQTTGINALGQSEPVILTDSKITQPVFATRVLLDHPANLSRLLAAHGMPEAGATWDQENGVLTARGPVSQLMAAQAAARAIDEAATAGVTVEMKVIEWKNGVPPAAKPVELLPPAKRSDCITLTAEAAAALLREPGAILRSSSHSVPAAGEDHVLADGTASVQAPDGSLMPMGARVKVTGVRRAGMALWASVSFTYSAVIRKEIIDGESWPVPFSATSSSHYRIEEGDWLQFDVAPELGETKPVTVLLSVRPAIVP